MSHEIEVRRIPFDFTDDSPPVWNPAAPEWSHMVNGASLVMPYLEPFLIRNIREALPLIADENLLADARAFIGQEAQHFTNHRRYNEMLKRSGYPELAAVEEALAKDYERLSTRSLAFRLAYTAGFETMTMGITEWLINDREYLFRDADPVVSSLVLWHMVEETEHKSVAYDVFQAISGRHLLRLFGLIYGSLHVGLLSRQGYIRMLKRDGRWHDLRSRLRLWRMVGQFFIKSAPAMIRSCLPGYHPDKVRDPGWIAEWRRAYGNLAENGVPLLNTGEAGIAPVFEV